MIPKNDFEKWLQKMIAENDFVKMTPKNELFSRWFFIESKCDFFEDWLRHIWYTYEFENEIGNSTTAPFWIHQRNEWKRAVNRIPCIKNCFESKKKKIAFKHERDEILDRKLSDLLSDIPQLAGCLFCH